MNTSVDTSSNIHKLPEGFEELLAMALIEMKRSTHIPTLHKLQVTENILEMIDNADEDQLFDINQRMNDFTKNAESYRATGGFFKAMGDSIGYRRAKLESQGEISNYQHKLRQEEEKTRAAGERSDKINERALEILDRNDELR